jgi:CheY-like chemotaxis protein
MTVLVVEDDDDVREGLEALLRRHGVDVTTTANGQEALDVIERDGPPDLMIVDLMMPVMNGWALRANLLADQKLASVPVVILSGVSDVQHHGRALQAVEVLTKPFAIEKLYAVVDAYCPQVHG